MPQPILQLPDDSLALFQRARVDAPAASEAQAFRDALDQAQQGSAEAQAEAARVDPDAGSERERDDAPLTIHTLNAMLLLGDAQPLARAASTANAGTAAHGAPGGKAGVQGERAAAPLPSASARAPAADAGRADSSRSSAPEPGLSDTPPAGPRREAPAEPAPVRAQPASSVSTTPSGPSSVTRSQAANVAAATVPVPVAPASERGPANAPRVATAVQAVQGAPAAGAGRRSGADAHFSRWTNTRAGAPGRSASNPALSQQQTQAFAAQVSRGLAAAMSRGNGEVTLRLNPESLGFLRVKLELKGESVAARFEASTNEARRLLEQSTETLRAALEARGWESSEIRVALLEERDLQPSAAELLRKLAREGEAVAQHVASAADLSDNSGSPSDPRSGRHGSDTPAGGAAANASPPGAELPGEFESPELVALGVPGSLDVLV